MHLLKELLLVLLSLNFEVNIFSSTVGILGLNSSWNFLRASLYLLSCHAISSCKNLDELFNTQLFNLKHLTSGAIVDFSSNLMDVKFHRISAITVFHRTDKVKTKRSIIFMQELIEILLLKSLLFGNVRKECGGRFYTHWLTSYLSN